jgi:signal transduction histidine kinase
MRDGEYFQNFDNGYYVVVKKTISLSGIGNNILAYCMIPVLFRYDYQHSDYLQTHFVYDKSAIKKIQISDKRTPYVVHSLSGKALFYLDQKAPAQIANSNALTGLFRILAFILLLAYIHFITEETVNRKGVFRGILLLGILLLVTRLLLFIFPEVFLFRQFELFNPGIYGSIDSWHNRSLGDLLINSVFLCWFVVFSWYKIGSNDNLFSFLKGRKLLGAGVCSIIILLISTFEFANIVRSLIADSKISFNVIDFFSLDIYTLVGFIVLALYSLAYYYLSRILFRIIFQAFEGRHILIYFLLALTGLLLLSFRGSNNVVLFQLPVLLWLIFYTLLLTREKFIINTYKATITGILFWIFIFSVSLAALIMQENKEKELRIRKSIAEKHDQLTDPSGEHTLSIALAYLDNDFLKNSFSRFRNPVENRFIRDSIIAENMSGYINKYDTKIFVFDSLNQPLNNIESLTYTELDNLFRVQSRATNIPDLRYHETSYDQYTYITKRAIRDSADLGTFFIISSPRKYNQEALYPELFRRINETDSENSPLYSFAIYSNNLLITSSTKYPFAINLTPKDIPYTEFERRINNGYDELWYKARPSKIVVVVKKQDSLIESITLFSYLFCAFLSLVALLQLIAILLRAGTDPNVLKIFWQLNIRSQVHSTIIFISILSFVVIGIATISFFISRYNRNNVDKISRTAGIMVKEMQQRIKEYSTFDDVIRIYDSVSNSRLKALMEDVADIHAVDVNVYNETGDLLVSSEDEVYRRGMLSKKMHPEAFYHLHRLRQVQHVQEESLSSLRYLSIYSVVRDEEGRVYAYLNIPYFFSQIDINQEISNFLVAIINLNAFIFLIAGVIALFITNKITRSFSIIGDKMKEIRLGKTNEEIIWNRNDEIGELVKQYNIMVHQLEQSAEALAKSEREGAWREMARQVAHEIKNPLTPMKLSIQYLQKALNHNQPNVKELTSSVANTLVEQIDHLSKIAADFSQFANIGNRHVEHFDLHNILESLKELYSSNPKVRIHWLKTDSEILMKTDRTHMNRLFTNIFTNAIDACVDRTLCRISIYEKMNSNKVIISIRDNGEGIAEEMQPKIFIPNFTTKSSGTGLGLAMCKSIVEQAGGDIWFETTPGTGTTFFVQLPVVN